MRHPIETAPMVWCDRCHRYISDKPGHDNDGCTPRKTNR